MTLQGNFGLVGIFACLNYYTFDLTFHHFN